jgi:hypothetical protein
VRLPTCRRYLGAWLLVAALSCGACGSKQTEIKASLPAPANRVEDEHQVPRAVALPDNLPYGFDKTEVDLEHGQLEPASLYHYPREKSLYIWDKTDVDLIIGPKKTDPSPPR